MLYTITVVFPASASLQFYEIYLCVSTIFIAFRDLALPENTSYGLIDAGLLEPPRHKATPIFPRFSFLARRHADFVRLADIAFFGFSYC